MAPLQQDVAASLNNTLNTGIAALNSTIAAGITNINTNVNNGVAAINSTIAAGLGGLNAGLGALATDIKDNVTATIGSAKVRCDMPGEARRRRFVV